MSALKIYLRIYTRSIFAKLKQTSIVIEPKLTKYYLLFRGSDRQTDRHADSETLESYHIKMG